MWIRIQVHYKIRRINALSLLSTHSSCFSIPLETNFKMHQLSCKGAQSHLWVEAAENWCQELLQWIRQHLALGCNLGAACFDKWHAEEINKMFLRISVSLRVVLNSTFEKWVWCGCGWKADTLIKRYTLSKYSSSGKTVDSANRKRRAANT